MATCGASALRRRKLSSYAVIVSLPSLMPTTPGNAAMRMSVSVG